MSFSSWLKMLKRRLATVHDSSIRYKLVESIWKARRVNKAHACTFYWVMLPSSVALVGLFAIVLCVAVVIFVPIIAIVSAIAWFLGFAPIFINDKAKRFDHRQKSFYPYCYSPRRGDFRKHAPWMYASPVLVLMLALVLGRSGHLSPILSATGSQVGIHWRLEAWIVGGIVGGFSICLAIGWFVQSQLRRRLGENWGKICPPLQVVNDPEPTKQAA